MSTTVGEGAADVLRSSSERFSDAPTRYDDVLVGGIELEIGQPCDAEIAARMTLRGRPDANCANEVAEILALIEGNVQIDLRRCVQLEGAIVATLARAFQELGSRGHDLEFLLPAEDADGARALSRSGIPAARLRIEPTRPGRPSSAAPQG